MMFGWYGGDWGIGGWAVMGLVTVLFWGGLITGWVLLLRRTPASAGAAPAPHHNAERLLSDRFARGEIDETEFETRRAALRHN